MQRIVDADSRNTIIRAVSKYADFVTPTYGPAGKRVLISDQYSVKAIDDGKIVSQNFELENEHENTVISYIKEATSKTDERVGDGTTTAAILMSELVKLVLEPKDDWDTAKTPHEEVLKLKAALIEAVAHIRRHSKKIKTQEELKSIALNSFGDENMAELIASTLFKIGKDGSLAVHDSTSTESECELVQGLELDKGFASPYLVNKDDSVSLDNPAIIVIAQKVNSFKELVPLIKQVLDSGRREIAIFADGFGEDVIANAVMNRMKGAFMPLLAEAPGFGESRAEALQDIAALTGAKVIDHKRGDELEKAELSVCGNADSIVSKRDKTTIFNGKGFKKDIDQRINELKGKLEGESKFSQEKLNERIAKLSGGVAIIRVGALTENEQKSIKAKVEDAVNATKAAFREGIVPGGAKTFESIETSSATLNEALKKPRKVLEENGKQFLDEKVFDPTEVLVASLETAVSIACGLIETQGIISVKREKEKDAIQY